MILLAVAACSGPAVAPPTTTTASTAETASDSASGPTGSTAGTSATGLPQTDTGWPLDPSCQSAVDLDLTELDHDFTSADYDDLTHCEVLLADGAVDQAQLNGLLGRFHGPVKWTGSIDWSTQDALVLSMLGCFKQYEYTITRLRHCADHRVAIDGTHLDLGSDQPGQGWWILPVAPGRYSGSITRMTRCNAIGECIRFLDGIELP